ncbi:MAG TPA: hypothetical protein VNJ71_09280 [Gemmatimonadales bacterium]|nr:hypothetical protein [Gemmatimonadales bacterium]
MMLVGMVAGTLWILLSQVVLAAAFTGIGITVRRGFGLPVQAVRDLFTGFWVGWAAVMALLLAWSFVWPVTGIPLLLVLAAGGAGLAGAAGRLRELPAREPWCRSPWFVLPLLLAALWVANLCRAPVLNPDTGLYHWQGVLWAKAYPTVPGLANLFGPLGFNNAGFLYDAMLDAGPWEGRAYHLANGLFVQVLLWQGFGGLVRAARTGGRERVQALFESLFLVPAAVMATSDWLSSFVTMPGVTAATLAAAAQAHRLLLGAEEDPREQAYTLIAAAALLCLAVTMKVSASVFAATCLAVCAWYWLRQRAAASGLRRRTLVWTLATVLLLGGSWAARGALLSGYPLFPSRLVSLPVEWRTPPEHADAEFAFAAHSSRASTENAPVVRGEAGLAAWLPEWWRVSATDNPYELLIPIAVGSVTLAAGLVLRSGPVPPTWWLLPPIGIALTVWFLTAPEPRYIWDVAWSAAALGMASLALLLKRPAFGAVDRAVLRAVVILAASVLLVKPLAAPHPKDLGLSPARRLLSELFLLPSPEAALADERHPVEVRTYVTRSGLSLNVVDHRCWDTPIPCTPNPAPNLRLRVPGRLARGFVVDGPWQMENWPAHRPEFGRAWFGAHHAPLPPNP